MPAGAAALFSGETGERLWLGGPTAENRAEEREEAIHDGTATLDIAGDLPVVAPFDVLVVGSAAEGLLGGDATNGAGASIAAVNPAGGGITPRAPIAGVNFCIGGLALLKSTGLGGLLWGGKAAWIGGANVGCSWSLSSAATDSRSGCSTTLCERRQ